MVSAVKTARISRTATVIRDHHRRSHNRPADQNPRTAPVVPLCAYSAIEPPRHSNGSGRSLSSRAALTAVIGSPNSCQHATVNPACVINMSSPSAVVGANVIGSPAASSPRIAVHALVSPANFNRLSVWTRDWRWHPCCLSPDDVATRSPCPLHSWPVGPSGRAWSLSGSVTGSCHQRGWLRSPVPVAGAACLHSAATTPATPSRRPCRRRPRSHARVPGAQDQPFAPVDEYAK
jgi:hypothetical protein